MSPGQPPPQQLLAPTYFSAPGVMNFGNPSYPYAPGALPPPPPPHLYPNTQVRCLIFSRYTSFKSHRNVVGENVKKFCKMVSMPLILLCGTRIPPAGQELEMQVM